MNNVAIKSGCDTNAGIASVNGKLWQI